MQPFIDCHHHLWDLRRNYHPWLTDRPVSPIYGDYSEIRRSYLLQDFKADWGDLRPLATVHIEGGAADPLAEARWVQEVSDTPSSGGYPQAIIAAADFCSTEVSTLLERLAEIRNVRGVRQLLAGRTDPWKVSDLGPLASDQWRRQIGLLARHGFIFELQVYYQHMPAAAELARQHPGVTFVLNHCGTPARRDDEGLRGWREGVRRLAECSNVAVKLSGFGMVEKDWTSSSIRPFVIEAIEAFGIERCMFASNFPVDGIMKNYGELWQEYASLAAEFTPQEAADLLHRNAARYYRVELAISQNERTRSAIVTKDANVGGEVT